MGGKGGVHLSMGSPASGVVRQCGEDGLCYAPTLTLANRDLPCHKYVQAASHQETLAPSHFSSKESEVIRADVQP